jgi:4-carboxymuconolactone decarboxylase
MTRPDDIHPESGSRLPLVKREQMDERGKAFYDAVAGPQSRTLVGLQGPSGIWLHSPELGERVRAVNQYLRDDTTLDRRLTELAIIDAVKHRKPVDGLGAKEALIVSFGREVFGERKVRSETFARALEVFGPRGVVGLAALMGNYAMTAVILNAVDQQLRPDQKPLL